MVHQNWPVGQAVKTPPSHGGIGSSILPRVTREPYGKCPTGSLVGVNCYEDPPVPIPNTEVKLIYVENTWLVTAWEDRTMPTQEYNSSQVSDLAAVYFY